MPPETGEGDDPTSWGEEHLGQRGCGVSPPRAATPRGVLANDLVGLMEHVWHNRQPERCSRLQIDRELDLEVDFYGNLCRMRAAENLRDEACRLPTREIGVRPKTREGPSLNPVHVGHEHGR